MIGEFLAAVLDSTDYALMIIQAGICSLYKFLDIDYTEVSLITFIPFIVLMVRILLPCALGMAQIIIEAVVNSKRNKRRRRRAR